MENDKKAKQTKLKKWSSNWAKFNLSLYINDFNFYISYWLFGLVAVVILFHIPLQNLLNFIIVDPILSTCPQNVGVDLVFTSIIIFAIVFLFKQLAKNLLPTINSLLFGFIIIMLYWVFIKNSSQYTFYHFSWGFTNTTYSSTFLLSILLVFFSYKPYMNPLQKTPSQFSLLDDFPSMQKYEDIYGRTGYATSVANHISHTSSDVSFAIGVIGDWGSGKSDFLIRLMSILEKDSENIIFEFNPWRVNKTDAIIDEFFRAFSNKLKPYNQSITGTINEYSSRVLKPARETQLKLVDAIIGSWFQDDDIQEKYKAINESIKAISKRIVIFIDDVDRLTGKEVMEILRIIRNTANFANTFFVVGVDQNYIVNVLRNTKDFANEEEYLKKVFQLTITLPAFKKDRLVGEIKKYLYTPDLSEIDKQKINLGLKTLGIDADNQGPELFLPSFTYETLLEKMLDNVRDLKRFCNSFKIAFHILKNEADIHDLLMLELIRNKNMDLYNSIRSRKLLTVEFDKPNQLIVNKDEWERFEQLLPEKDKDVLKKALDFIFTDNGVKNQRKLFFPHNFYVYFSYQLFNLISFHEFNETLEKNAIEILPIFNKWIEEGKENELFKIISNLDDFKDSDSFKKIVVVLLRLSRPGSYWFDQAKQLIYINWQWNHKKYFQSKNEIHKQFICSILTDVSIDPYIRASMAFQYVRGMEEDSLDESQFFLKRKELRNLIYSLFDEYLKSNPTDPLKTLEFFYANDYKVEHGHVVRFPPACRRFKNYLLSNFEGLRGYTSILLRPWQFPYKGKFVLEPWLEQIFPDWQVLQAKLHSTDFNDETINRLRKIILDYMKAYFNSGKQPFEITNQDDKRFVELFLNLKEYSTDRN